MTLENTLLVFSSISVNNLLNNIKFLCDNYQARQLSDVLPKDIPAILISAGPSLNKNIIELKKAKNKAFIVAVDTAVKPLLKAGIEPDLMVMVDGEKPKMLFEIEKAQMIPLVMSITSSAEVANYHKGKKFFFNEGEPYVNEIFKIIGQTFYGLDSGGSVATTVMSLLVKLGYSTIILVGQDLALTGNKTHADGTFKEQMETVDTSKCVMVEGYYGDKVPTRGDFRLYLEWFNDYIKGIKEIRPLNVIDATEGGAKIENTDRISLKECIEKYCVKWVNIKEEIEKIPLMFQETDRPRIIEYLHNTKQNLLDIKKNAEKGKKLYSDIQKLSKKGTKDKESYTKILKKINKLHSKIEGNVTWKLIYKCIAPINYVIRREMFYQKEIFEEEIYTTTQNGIAMMVNIMRCVDILLPLVEETVCNIE